MNRWIAHVGATLVLVTLASGLAFGQTAKKEKPKAATCPVCHMALSSKKTKENPVAVKVGGKTMYCCSKCDMHHKPEGKTTKPTGGKMK